MRGSELLIPLLSLSAVPIVLLERHWHISTKVYFATYFAVYGILHLAKALKLPIVTNNWALLQPLYVAVLLVAGAALIVYHAQRRTKPPVVESS